MYSVNNLDACKEELAVGIVSSLKNAIEHDMPEIMEEYDYDTKLGYGLFRWNPIIKYLRGMCDHLGWIEFSKLKRGAWKVPVLFWPNQKVLLTLMTENTFKDLRGKRNRSHHYLFGCASFNTESRSDQIKFDMPDATDEDEKWVAHTQEEFAQAVHADVEDIKEHILVLFDVVADELLSVRAVRLTADFLTADLEITEEKEDWSGYIRCTFDTAQQVVPQQNEEDDDEMFVTL